MDTAFEELLSGCIAGDSTLVEAERHLLDAPGAKRVRPKFLLACGGLLGVPEKELLESAAAVELMHTATLLHDDIIDKAEERRSRPSVHAAYGTNLAILAGDCLFLRPLMMLAGLKNGAEAVKQAVASLLEIAEAMALEEELELAEATPAEVIRIADGKTGALFGLCGYLAGFAADDIQASQHLMKAGRMAGRAFQLRDDIEDIDEDTANGVPTLPQLISPAEVERTTVKALQAAAGQLEPYAGRPGYSELIRDLYKLARTPEPVSTL